MLTVGSLFAGIGGFDLGFERAGMRTLWFCEQDPFCQRVLARHWPGVPCHPDVRALVADTGRRGVQHRGGAGNLHGEASQVGEHGRAAQSDSVGDGGEARQVLVPVPHVDLLCGGFPCQDLSFAGRGAGLAGERSGLWREFARLIGELRPRYVVAENVPALTSRGLDVVLADLAARGFDAEWDHLPASAFGAPHRRDRIWLVAYPASGGSGAQRPLVAAEAGADARAGGAGAGPRDVPDADSSERRPSEALPRPGEVERPGRRGSGDGDHWLAEPDVGRVAHGVPQRVDRLRALGNSLVPQIAEWIGGRIVEWERDMRPAA